MHSANFLTEFLNHRENFYMKLEAGERVGIEVGGGDNQQKKANLSTAFYRSLESPVCWSGGSSAV